MASVYPALKGLGKFLLGASPASLFASGLLETKGLNAGEDEELQRLKGAQGLLNTSFSSPPLDQKENSFPPQSAIPKLPSSTTLDNGLQNLPFSPVSPSRTTVSKPLEFTGLDSNLKNLPSTPVYPSRPGIFSKAPELTVPNDLKNFQYAPSSPVESSSSSLASLLGALTTSRFRTGGELYRQAMPFMDYGLSKQIENLRKDYERDLNDIMENPYLSARTRAAYLAAIHNKYELGLKGILADADYPSMVAGRIAPGLVEDKTGITSSSLPSLVKLLNYQQDYPYKLLRTLNLYQKTTGASPLTLYQQAQLEHQQAQQERQQAKDLYKTVNSAVTTLLPKAEQGDQRNQLSLAVFNTLQHMFNFNKLSPEQQQEAVQLAAQINHMLLSNQETGNLIPDLLSGGLGAALGFGVGKYSVKRLVGNPTFQKLVNLVPSALRGHGLFSKVFPATLAALAGMLGYAAVPDISSAPPGDVLNTKFNQDMTGQGLLNALSRGVPPWQNVVSGTGQMYNLSPSEQQLLQTYRDRLKQIVNSGQ